MINGLLDLGIGSGPATDISGQLELKGRAEIIFRKADLSTEILAGNCEIKWLNQRWTIKVEEGRDDSDQVNLIFEPVSNT
jgi:hypothetical protein